MCIMIWEKELEKVLMTSLMKQGVLSTSWATVQGLWQTKKDQRAERNGKCREAPHLKLPLQPQVGSFSECDG